ncbi:MAG: restriction endonuclease subunit S [Candidatus Magasanikbacteria bacterium]|nr:restriction endonuclease subunit S [Candidatus Magasanikbacteria bacterium]
MTTWSTKKLGEVADIVMGQSPPSSSYNERGEGLPFFQGKAEFGEIYPTPVKYCSSPSRIAEANDVLMSVRAPVGNINIAKEKSCVGRGLGALRAKKNILNQMFLFYFMKKNENNWSRLSTGSTFSAIKGSSLKNFEIPLPPIAIQKQIVERLDKIAEAQKLNDDLIRKADELFQSLLHKELNPVRDSKHSNGVNPAGKDWKVKKLGDVAETSSGGTPLKEKAEYYENGTIPWLRSGEVSQGLIYKSELFITEKGLKESSAKIFPINTVLVAMYGATTGQIGLLKFEASTNQAICGIFPNSKFVPEYLYYFLKTKTNYLIKISAGGAQPNISQAVIRNLKIPLPPLQTQKQIVAKLSAVQSYKKELLEQKIKLKELFDSALHRAMSSGLPQ